MYTLYISLVWVSACFLPFSVGWTKLSKYLNSYIFTTWWCKLLIFQTKCIWSNTIHSLKYLKSAGCKDIGIRKSAFVAKTQFLCVQETLDGGLIQWGRSNKPRIRPGTEKSERAMGVVIVSPRTGLCQENWPLYVC